MSTEPWAQLVSTTDPLSDPVEIRPKKFVIGRAKDADLSLFGNQLISSKHCTIECSDDGKYYLTDTSTNGTLLNLSKKVHRQKRAISHGDEIHLVYKKTNESVNLAYLFQVMEELEAEEQQATLEDSSGTIPNDSMDTVIDENNASFLIDHSPPTKRKREESEEKSNSDPETKAMENLGEKKSAPENKEEPEDNKSETGDDATDSKGIEEYKDGEGGSKDGTPSDKVVASTSKGNEDDGADEIEETLMCVICQEIMHDCISLQPCMHSFCSGCYSDWMNTSTECPTCRLKVDRINKNHIVNNLIEAFLSAHPGRRRRKEDLEELDKKNKITKDMMYPDKPTKSVEDDSDEEDEENDEEEEEGEGQSDSDDGLTTAHPLPIYTYNHRGYTTNIGGVTHQGIRAPSTVCRSCPGYVPTLQGLFPPRVNAPSVQIYVCQGNPLHMLCQCCLLPMPDRTPHRVLDPTIPPQKCESCSKMLCHVYWGCRNRAGCKGCLTKLSEYPLPNPCLDGILLGNPYESNLLRQYLHRKNITDDRFFRLCLGQFLPGNSLNAQVDTYLCNSCCQTVFRDMAYEYRKTLTLEDVGDVKRPDCHWGKNCRTQRNNPLHARRFNHICEQTQFA